MRNYLYFVLIFCQKIGILKYIANGIHIGMRDFLCMHIILKITSINYIGPL